MPCRTIAPKKPPGDWRCSRKEVVDSTDQALLVRSKGKTGVDSTDQAVLVRSRVETGVDSTD